MKRILLTMPLFLLAAACASRPGLNPEPYLAATDATLHRPATTAATDLDATDAAAYFAAAEESPKYSSSASEKNVVRALVGGTTDRGGGGFTLGGQYEYRVTESWGAGAFADITFGDKDTVFVLGGGAFWHPVENLTLLGGVGFDFDRDDAFARVGGSYDFNVKSFKLGPAVYVDLGAKGTPIMGGLIVSFDF